MKLSRTFVLAYGVFCYLLHWVATFYLIGFMGNIWWRKTIDSEPSPAGTIWALVIDVSVIVLFVFLHWLMARPWFKKGWLRWTPEPMQRSTYVLVTCLTLALLFWMWQPIAGDVWRAPGKSTTRFLNGVYLSGWALAIASTFPINHWELFGIRQAWIFWQGRQYAPPKPQPSILYRLLPHPIFVGYTVALWAAARMGWAHFFFSGALSTFLLIDLRLAADEG